MMSMKPLGEKLNKTIYTKDSQTEGVAPTGIEPVSGV